MSPTVSKYEWTRTCSLCTWDIGILVARNDHKDSKKGLFSFEDPIKRHTQICFVTCDKEVKIKGESSTMLFQENVNINNKNQITTHCARLWPNRVVTFFAPEKYGVTLLPSACSSCTQFPSNESSI